MLCHDQIHAPQFQPEPATAKAAAPMRAFNPYSPFAVFTLPLRLALDQHAASQAQAAMAEVLRPTR